MKKLSKSKKELQSKFSYNKLCKMLIDRNIKKKELQEMIDEGKSIEVNCHFCNKNYEFSVEELKELLSQAVR